MNRFSVNDLVGLVEMARKTGAKSIEIHGFLIVSEGEIEPKIGVSPPQNNPQNIPQDVERCEDCSSTDLRPSAFSNGNYCHDCYLDKKEKKWKDKKTW